MIIYIRSKSGDYNSTQHVNHIHGTDTLQAALWKLRTDGGYYYTHKDEELFLPFEQILYIEEKRIVDIDE